MDHVDGHSCASVIFMPIRCGPHPPFVKAPSLMQIAHRGNVIVVRSLVSATMFIIAMEVVGRCLCQKLGWGHIW
jgi:hypothetical protein